MAESIRPPLYGIRGKNSGERASRRLIIALHRSPGPLPGYAIRALAVLLRPGYETTSPGPWAC